LEAHGLSASSPLPVLQLGIYVITAWWQVSALPLLIPSNVVPRGQARLF
jgi:hypothetical protein